MLLSVQDERSHSLSEEDDKQSLGVFVHLDEILGVVAESEEDSRLEFTVEKSELLVTNDDLDFLFGIFACELHQYNSFSSCTKWIFSVFWLKLKVLCPVNAFHFSNWINSSHSL